MTTPIRRPQLLTLRGNLGKDRDLRETRPQTKIVTAWNEIAEMNEEHEITIPPRDYIRLSLATRERGANGWETRWVHLVAWDLDRDNLAGIRLARQGDQIEITGTREVFTFTGEDGQERTFHYVSVATFKSLRRKIRFEAA